MTKATGKGRGRVKVPLREDPDRYRLAFIMHEAASPDVESARSAAGSYAILKFNDFTLDEVKALRRGPRLDFDDCVKTDGTEAEAERLRRKLRLCRKNPEDESYLGVLAAAFIIARAHPDYFEAWDQSLALCTTVGEQDWFVHALAPYIKERFGRL